MNYDDPTPRSDWRDFAGLLVALTLVMAIRTVRSDRWSVRILAGAGVVGSLVLIHAVRSDGSIIAIAAVSLVVIIVCIVWGFPLLMDGMAR